MGAWTLTNALFQERLSVHSYSIRDLCSFVRACGVFAHYG